MKLKKRLAALAVSAVMVITMLPSAVFAHEGKYKIYKGSFTYYDNDTSRDEQGTFYYSDSYFAEPGTQLNEHLRTLSTCVSVGANGEKTEMLAKMGFGKAAQYDMDTPGADTIGTVIASKKTTDGDNLIVVYLRGTGYGSEWISNLTVGESGDAEGFAKSAKKVYDRIITYEKTNGLKGAKIWITGFSRAGAVADMTGKLVNENLSEFGITENDLYDYAFAVPRASATNCGYKNIHDVVNSNDLIPRLMPAAWGIGRAGTQELFSIGNTTVQPKRLNIMGGDLISDKMVQDIDPETGRYGPLHPADPISTAEHLDKLADLLGKNITRENFDSAREVLPPFVSELVQGAIHGGSELMTFIKNTFAGITKDMTALQYILILLAANENSEEYQNALTAFNYIIAEKIESSPDKDKLSPELVKLTKDALPVVIKVFLPALRYDFIRNQGETLVTFIGNASDIIYNHYPSTYYRNLIKYDSYYTEKGDVDAGTMRYFGKEYSGSDPDTIRQLNLLDADKDIELLKNGYDVEYKMTYAGIYDSDITPEDRAAVETAIGAKPDIDIFVNTYITRSQTFGTAERIELDGTVEASFKCLPSETERLYHNGNYYFVYYKDGQAQIADATFTLRDDGILAVEYKSIARGNYALCYVSTAPKESMRIYGNNRYETSTKAADQLLKEQGRKTFKSVIVASGKDYPDALSAAYLAKVKDAPILLTDDNHLLDTVFYISAHCDMGTDVYVIGGEGAVSGRLDKLLTSMTDKPMNVIRLAGKNRYQTNIEVLKAASVTNEQMLIASGASYADAISASAVGKPLLLAAASGLTREQTEYLATLSTEKATIIGGTAAVTQKVENQLKGIFKTTERIGGKSRYETSANIAKKFFVKSFTVVLAYGGSFPDGLSGAPLAMRYEAPMVLVADTNYSYAKKYAESADAKKTVTFGGTPLISDKTVNSIVPN
ncbi:MAG: cell wall-binding repeat-containing protein [Ruminococcus sp.]|nr:cell wall-binding repeat-containing protein [Ruminococcus sp.]